MARDPVSAHASTITFRDTATFLDVADQCLGHGFRAIELHAWGVPIKDALLGQDLRAQVGPNVALMYDGIRLGFICCWVGQ